MLNENTYVSYNVHGVCKIERIELKKNPFNNEKEKYYILKPVKENSATVFVPVDNEKLVSNMKPILTKNEINDLILSVDKQDVIWNEDIKQRTNRFNEIILQRDERELLTLISTLYLKSINTEKGITPSEKTILKKAENIIHEEFAFALDLEEKDISKYIRNVIKNN